MRTQCAHCFLPLETGATAFRCVGSCQAGIDEIAGAFRGHRVDDRPAFVVEHSPGHPPAHADCPRCRTRTSAQICARCHGRLPADWRSYATTCIALAGARYSGKSVYIGVLINQLQWLAEAAGTVLRPITSETAELYRDRYQRALFEMREIVGPTQSQIGASHYLDPLIYSFTPATQPRHALVIRDVAGEDLQRVEGLDAQVFGFLGHADEIVFLVDPMQVRSIREQLAGKHAWGGVEGDDPLTVLHNIADLRRRLPDAGPVVLALTLAKFDVLHALGAVPGSHLEEPMRQIGAAYLRDPSMESTSYDLRDSELLDAELRSLLTFVNGRALLHLATREFPQTRCFAVSALGHHPKAERLGRTGITPFRCLDPVKYLLALRGLLPSVLAPT